MTNPNQGDRSDRTNHPAENQPDSYGSGYTQGQSVERQRYESVQQTRDENNSANGFLIGILLTAVVLGGAALAYFATQRDHTPTIQRTIVVPSSAPSPSPSPEVKERVIERDRIVPVPQPQQSSPIVAPAPTIKVEPPKPAPTPEASPATPKSSQSEPSTEQPKPAQPSPSPEATTNPTPSGQ